MAKWYQVDAILKKRIMDGVIQYLIKWTGYVKSSWEPFWNVGYDLIRDYEEQERAKQVNARRMRWERRRIKREQGLPLNEIPIPDGFNFPIV